MSSEDTGQPLIGRDAPLAVADAAIAAAARGRGCLVLIGGDAGIGKSRLVQEIERRAVARGMTGAHGFAVDDPGAPPLWPWRRALRLLPDALAVLEDTGSCTTGARFTMFVEFADRLLAATGPRGLVLVLEDMHWADELSVLLLTHLCTELPDSRVGVVITYRPSHQGPLRAGLHQLIRGRSVIPVALDGLTRTDVRTWLRGIPGLDQDPDMALTLRARTAGNPLLVRLLIEALVANPAAVGSQTFDRLLEQRPDVRQLVAGRADAMGPQVRGILRAASVLGEEIAPRLLAGLTGLTTTDLDPLLAEATLAGILRPSVDEPGGLRFTHALVRDAVYADLDPDTRSRWHRASAVVLESIEGPAAAGRITMHWHRAAGSDATDRCWHWARRAAAQAGAALAFDEAARFAALACEQATLAGAPVAVLAELSLDRARAQFDNADIREASDSCVEAAELSDRAGRPDLLAAAGLVIHGIGSPTVNRVVSRLCQRALDHPGVTDPVIRARLLAQLAVAAAEDGGGAAAADLAAAAVAAAEATGDQDAVLEAIAARHLSIAVPSTVAERLELGRRAVELGRTAVQPMAVLWGHLWRVDAAFQLGNLAEVDRELAEIDRIARTHRSGLARWHHHRLMATRSALLGDFSDARGHNEAARTLAERMGEIALIGMYHAFNFELANTRGDPTELPEDGLEVFKSAPAMPLIQLAACSWQILSGRRDEARATFATRRPPSVPARTGPCCASTL